MARGPTSRLRAGSSSPSTYALGTLCGFSSRKLAAVTCCRLARKGPARGGRALAADLVLAYPKSLELRVALGFTSTSDGRGGEVLLRGHMDGRAGSGLHRLSPSQGPAIDFSGAQAAIRRWFRSLQHRRCRLHLRLDPNAGRPRWSRFRSGASHRVLVQEDAGCGAGIVDLISFYRTVYGKKARETRPSSSPAIRT